MLRLQPYRYHRPRSLADALELLERHGADAMPVAGGTDLVPNMKHGLFAPAHLVAVKGLPELRGFEEREQEEGGEGTSSGELVIGAGETLTAVSRDPLVRRWAPSLAEAAGRVAAPQLRNAGTLGGNLCLDTRCTYYNQTHFWRKSLGYCLKKDGDVCHVTKVGKKCVAAHSADTPPVLMTVGARVDLVSAAGERTLDVADFFVADGIANTVREPGELVVRVRVPLPGPRARFAFRKVRQRGSVDFPLLNLAVAMDFEPDDDVVTSIAMVVSALGSRPRALTGLEKIAVGERLTEEVTQALAERAHAQCRPLTNIIVDPDWRRAMVPIEVRRALREISGADGARAA